MSEEPNSKKLLRLKAGYVQHTEPAINTLLAKEMSDASLLLFYEFLKNNLFKLALAFDSFISQKFL